jgi:hypothetical protein
MKDGGEPLVIGVLGKHAPIAGLCYRRPLLLVARPVLDLRQQVVIIIEHRDFPTDHEIIVKVWDVLG